MSTLDWLRVRIDILTRYLLVEQISTKELCSVILQGDTQRLMPAADLAITKSGSVNLELALHNVSKHFFLMLSALL